MPRGPRQTPSRSSGGAAGVTPPAPPLSQPTPCQALKVDQPGIEPKTFDAEDHAVNHSATFLIRRLLCTRHLVG